MKFKRDDEGNLVLDEGGDPIAMTEAGKVIPLDKVVSIGKHVRIEGERDEYKAQVDALQGQITELQKVGGDKEELEKKLAALAEGAEKTKADLESRMAARDKEYALETALLKAGCRDTVAARAHMDIQALEFDGKSLGGLDLEAFRKDKPYLFDAIDKLDTAAISRGTAGDNDDAQMRSIMGLKEHKE